jgi:hypothetical protein
MVNPVNPREPSLRSMETRDGAGRPAHIALVSSFENSRPDNVERAPGHARTSGPGAFKYCSVIAFADQ